MKGDYHRYLAEFATGDRRGKSSEESLAAYKSASEIAASNLGSFYLILAWFHAYRCATEQHLLTLSVSRVHCCRRFGVKL